MISPSRLKEIEKKITASGEKIVKQALAEFTEYVIFFL
jgi:hypothetical protein